MPFVAMNRGGGRRIEEFMTPHSKGPYIDWKRSQRLDKEVKLKDSITQEDVLLILKMVEASNTDELHLETGDLKLIIRRIGRLRGRIEVACVRRKASLGCRHSSRQGISFFCC
jgi:hypothetical protein